MFQKANLLYNEAQVNPPAKKLKEKKKSRFHQLSEIKSPQGKKLKRYFQNKKMAI